MPTSWVKICICFVTFVILTACSSTSGEWPSLSEPLPEVIKPKQVITRAKPSVSKPKAQPSGGETIFTVSTAIKLYQATTASLGSIRTTYETAKAKIAGTTEEEQVIFWREAQLQLTRYSNKLSKLDALIEDISLKDKPIWQKAVDTKKQLDAYIVAERAALAALEPKG